MADKKISALTAATTPLAGTEVLPVVQGGATVKVAVSDLTAGRAIAASSINKVAITAPATASTLTIADGKTLAVNDNATLGTGGLTLGNSGGFTAAASKVLTANNSLTLAGTDATTMTFPTTSATIARTDAAQTFTGNQTLGTGNLVQGTAAKGVNFTANTPAAGMTSQLMNWYEEGSWVGQLVPSASGSITMSSTACSFTRFGNAVTVSGLIVVASVSSPVGYLKITGLPYSGKATAAFRTAMTVIGDGLEATMTTSLVATIQSDSNIYISKYNGLGSQANCAQDIKAGTTIFIGGTYQV